MNDPEISSSWVLVRTMPPRRRQSFHDALSPVPHLFTNGQPALSQELQDGVAFYQEQHIGQLIKCTFESVRLFHSTFHRGCIIDGIDQPDTWSKVDVSFESQFLRYKNTVPYSVPLASHQTWKASGSSYRSSNNQPEEARKKTKDKPSLKCNFGNDRFNCYDRYQCRDCGWSIRLLSVVVLETPIALKYRSGYDYPAQNN